MRLRKYQFNDNFFSEYNEKSCYWAGFIAADGTLATEGQNKNCLAIALNKKDKSHLEKFLQDTKSNYPIYETQSNNATRVQVYSRKIVQDLINNFGITPRKSLTIQLSPKIPVDFLPHFIRGVIDGDGSFTILKRKTGNHQWRMSLCGGSLLFLEAISKILNKITGSKAKVKWSSGAWNISYNGNCILKKMTSWLYSNASVFLTRKQPPIINLIRKQYVNT